MGVKCMCYTKILYDNFQSMPSVNTIMIAFLNSRYFTGCLHPSRPSCLCYRISPRSETGDYRKRRWRRHSLKKVNGIYTVSALPMNRQFKRLYIIDYIKPLNSCMDVLFYLTCLALYSFWIVRCNVKKEVRRFSGNSSLEELKRKLKFRILVDSQRYKNDRRIFFKSWAIGDVLCSIDAQGGLTYHF